MTFRVHHHEQHGWFWEMSFLNGKLAATSDVFYTTERGAILSARRVAEAFRGGLYGIESPSGSVGGVVL